MTGVVYLDNNATTRVDPGVASKIQTFFSERYGNPSSVHCFGRAAGEELKQAREHVAGFLGCQPGEIVFTACGTESDNAALRSALEVQPEKRHIITTQVEHPAVFGLCKYLEENKGYQVTYLPVDSAGELDLDRLQLAIRPDTAVISIMWANNETGVLFPIQKIAELAREFGVLLHTDAVQAAGKIPIDLSSCPIDMLSLSGHKLHAPKGIGALFVRKGTPFQPFIIGGGQEGGRRAGTENTTGIIGLGLACALAGQDIEAENARVAGLRDKLENGLLQAVPDARVNGGRAQRLPNTTNISFANVDGTAVLRLLDQLGICASAGSACASGSMQTSHVLRAMGVPFAFAKGSIRFSLSRYTRVEEIDFVLEHLPGIIERLRNRDS